MRNIVFVAIAAVMFSAPLQAKEMKVNRYNCKNAQASIDYVREEQRKTNQGRRADQLNEELRDYRNLYKQCKKAKYL